MTFRNLARLGAAGLLATSALGFAAAPAFAAATVDFGLSVKGATIAADASGKFATVTVTNNGSSKPAAVDVLFDATQLDTSKVVLSDLSTDCKVEAGIASCALYPRDIPAAGGSTDLGIPLKKVAGATGAAGKLTVTLAVEGDTNKANDSATVNVTVGGNGADLATYAQDVTAQDKNGDPNGKPVAPGALGSLFGFIENQGDLTAVGVKVEVALPQQSSFPKLVEGCKYGSGKRTLVCVFDDIYLIPSDEDNETAQMSIIFFRFPVLVSADAKGPVSLTDGSVTATPLDQQKYSARQAKAVAQLPAGFSAPTAAALAQVDADPTDNTDGFAVLVAGAAGGDGGQGGGEGLPVTGPAAFALGGGGIAVIALGLVLFFVARRRRIVLVTPGDAK